MDDLMTLDDWAYNAMSVLGSPLFLAKFSMI